MRKLFSTLLIFAVFILPCCAEALPEEAWNYLPETAVLQSVQKDGEIQLFNVSILETGEALILTCGASGEILSLETVVAAAYNQDVPAVDRSRAEEIVQQAYPGSRILFAEDDTKGKLLGIAGDNFCGRVVVAGDGICFRTLEMGQVFRNGILTDEGARKVMALHRAEAEIRELELDEDDGAYEYEGEAIISGEKYEFELSAATGKLLEWERD